ncbi:P-loop NTPase family protein [Spiroplasma taiwanense]|uniref:Uncharacterized protein n=1 Tax=Spiroplasma taiwanense CT-1 TaxID=1276220 RepID=S5LWV1_9MOLU|nr:hypothetical protein [Spiroplasma taiwanense]AGR41111.1 hypothetical protein STAIW_v1c04680 [Spiroplasma taiwanense CT-1]
MNLNINFENTVKSIENSLNNKEVNSILLNGPTKSGKTSVLNQLKLKTDSEGWNTIYFNISEFDQSKDYLEYFLARLLSYFKDIIGKKAISLFLKQRDIKGIIKKKIKTNNRASEFRFQFKQKFKKDEVDKKKLNNIQTLIELNKTLAISQFKWIIIFDEIDNSEIYNIKQFYDTLTIVQTYLKSFKIIISANLSKIENEYEKAKSINTSFDAKMDLEFALDNAKHENIQVNLFIKQQKVTNLFLINSIDTSLIEFEKWINKYYNFNYNEKDKRYYYDEIYFLAWFLFYLKNENNLLFNILKNNFNLYMQIINEIDVSLILENDEKIANLRYIELLLKNKEFKFQTKLKYLEIINLIKDPFNLKIPIFLTTAIKNDFLNIINELSSLILFKSTLLYSQNLIENYDSLTFQISVEDFEPELKSFIKYLNPRSIEQLKNSKVKSSFDKNLNTIIEKIFSLIN